MTTLQIINTYLEVGIKDMRISEIKTYLASLLDSEDPDIMKQVIFDNMSKIVNESLKIEV